MSPQTIFYIIIAILSIDFIVDKILDSLNAKNFDNPVPEALADVYDKEAYKKSQAYKKTNYKFSNISSLFSLCLTLGFFFFDGFEYVDE
ncbi:MAG: M48 family peptidase, partial [Galbibacter orientalis]